MDRIVKTLKAENGELYVTSAGLRRKLARFSGEVRIVERQAIVPVLGTVQRGAKRMTASFAVTNDIDYQTEAADGLIGSGRVYDAVAYVECVRTVFAGLRFEDSDPFSNSLIFEVTDMELIQKLAAM